MKANMTWLLILMGMWAVAGTAAAEENERICEALFVHNADEITLEVDTLTMKGFSPTVVYFCDRPVRLAGHLSVEEFLSSVTTGRDNFIEDPPNAVVSIADGKEFVDVVVTLNKMPTIKGDTLVYEGIGIIEGQLPKKAGGGSIFIDIIGRPMTPMSIAGVHRRTVRRAVRRCAAGVTCY